MKNRFSAVSTFQGFLLVLYVLFGALPAEGYGGLQSLSEHMPTTVAVLKPMGHLAGTNRLDLAIGLPLRNTGQLSVLLQQISDPASPNFRHYLTPAQFTEKFGPSEADYEAVAAFATAHGLKVSARHSNRLLLDVSGAVADIEQTLHIKMQVYQHPTEARTFYAPDSEPSLDLVTPVLHVSGLDNYVLPHPCLRPMLTQAQPELTGSGPSGAFMGNDFRAAYVPGVTLTGTGQTVGLLEFDSGYYQSDIAAYETLAGLPNVPVSAVLLDGYGGGPGYGNDEVSLDIEMAISMAPGLTSVLVYEGSATDDILNRMATDNLAKQIGASWTYPIDATSEQIFLQFAAQGQSFFNASGDSDAYTGAIPTPADDPNIMVVGGTTLTTTGPGGAWVSETVWNWGNEYGPGHAGEGGGGGISTVYPIPNWQTNISMVANQGSTTMRNLPDVALTADNVYVTYGAGHTGAFGGTSCATPLWAAFTALVNQRAVTSGRPTVGFINPALDTIGSGPNYSACFHDITTGNNTSPYSPSRFYAVAGYDLCTGWGVPTGQSLINALATPDPLGVQPDTGFTAVGGSGGPFTVTSENFFLSNVGTNSLNWSMVNTSLWLTVSPLTGTLAGGSSNATVTVSLSAGAYGLPIGNYSAVVAFSNVTSGIAQSRQFALQVVPSVPPTILTAPSNQFAAVGANASFTVTAGGTPPLSYQWQVNQTNIVGATNTSLNLTNVSITEAGSYTVMVTNTLGSTNATAMLTVGYPPSITGQPQSVGVVQGSNAVLSVTAAGTGPLSYQWYFYGVTLAGATSPVLSLTNIQPPNSGVYSVGVSSPFGSILSSNAALTVEVFPIIGTQPQSQSAAVGSNVTFSVTALASIPVLPLISSGTLQLWLKADAGVVTNSAGLVSQWQDQSGNTNHAFQSNTNLQPALVSVAGLGGKTAVRFNGIDNNINGSYLHGTGLVNVPNAMTAFTVYSAFSSTNSENLSWLIGVPGTVWGASRGDWISGGVMGFTFWAYDFPTTFVVPTNLYRIRTDRLDTNLDTLNVFDATAATSTNFTMSVDGAVTPAAGYYIGGLDASLIYVSSSDNFCGDLAETICYQGFLSEADRLAVTAYLEQKYFQIGSSGNLSYQWQFNGTNISNATNAFLTLANVQFTNAGVYTVTVSNLIGVTTSSNATLTVGYAPSITSQPQSVELAQGSNAMFSVTAIGTGPLNYQWSFNGAALAQGTNSSLTLTNVQGANGGSYSVAVSSPFGSVLSSNATLTVDLFPVIVTQPQSQTVLVGTNIVFSVTVANAGSAKLPTVSSGTLQLWLKADTGVVTNAAGLVSQWQDQSGNTNHAFQSNTNLQPALVSVAGLGGKTAVRFNGIDNNINGSYLHGTGLVNVPNAMTAFTVYSAFSSTNSENLSWLIGVPGTVWGASRGDWISGGVMGFTFWAYDFPTTFVVPTNLYRIRTDRLDTNLDTLNVFDATAATSTNFTMSVDGAVTPAAGYYLGGLNTALPYVSSSDNFCGDIAETICYQGYLSETDRQAVTGYLTQKYFQTGSFGNLSYQWQFNGTNIAGATNASLSLTNVQITNDGAYTVTVSNLIGATTSSNAVLAVGQAPAITAQPQNVEAAQGSNAMFSVSVTGTGPMNYQWSFNGTALSQATNSNLSLTSLQATNSGSYNVLVSSPFGSTTSSNATLTVDLLPIISIQPQSQTALVGTNIAFSVTVANAGSAKLPTVSSGTLQLWLKADTGVVTNAAGLVSQWQDQSGNANHAFQSNTNLQPALVSVAGLGGKAALRFNGIQNNVNGSYMHGTGLVSVPKALTEFTVYNAFSATNIENELLVIGIPGQYGAIRAAMITFTDLHYSFWSYDWSAPFVVPTNTYRIRTDRLDTNLDTLNMFDATAASSTNFTMSVNGAVTPGAGYYLGGLDASVQNVGTSRNFNGDIAETICYQGYLSETDRQAVTGYLTQKYFQTGSFGNLSYQWQFNGTNIAGATNASLSLTNVQITNDGIYTVMVSNLIGGITSSNALLAVGYAPSITAQPKSVEAAQGSNAMLSVSVTGTGPLSYQWSFNGAALSQATNSNLSLTSLQATNSGSYNVLVSSPFGSVLSSNGVLTVDLLPIIVAQPQSGTILAGSNVTFAVTTTTMSELPATSSGTLQLWLKADAGVITNSTGLVNQWQDQSGNANDAWQTSTNLEPLLVAATGLGGKAAVRFNGIQNNINGSYMFGTGLVRVPNAMTAFTVYNALSATNSENLLWDIGIPGQMGYSRGDLVTLGLLRFTLWSLDYSMPLVVPTNTYRIRTDRLDTNLDTLNVFDTTAASATNFTVPVGGAMTPQAGYYLGGLNSSLSGVGASRNFYGDIAELICYSGYLSEADRLAVQSYLEQKYYQNGSPGNFSYQWQYKGTNIAGATNATLTLTNVQTTNDGAYSVIVSNGFAFAVSSNAVLTVGWPPIIVMQPASQSVELNCSATFSVSAKSVAPVNYQWWNNGQPLAGQTNSSLVLTNVQSGNFGDYNVVLTNILGATVSAVAVLAPASLPVANPDVVLRFAEGGVRLNVSDLKANDTVAYYDTLTVIDVSSNSTAGGTVTLNSPWIYYAPPAGGVSSDSFTYTVSDGHCGIAIGTVTVQIKADNSQPSRFAIGQMGNGSLQLTFDGIPGQAYQVQCTDTLSPPNWQALTNPTTDNFGVGWVTDWPATNGPGRFYRAVAP